ncbi:Dehydrogenase orsE [Pseudocercospora fuligena]|uniref:Dehydrogenase orsE n=1 Tax=Pseudocercospora fuligena TaxID=685502 RepID=A0A8H6VHA6_9PEZI|nr:Dehydrogenase orsE [Pseudocercospora fuligena]
MSSPTNHAAFLMERKGHPFKVNTAPIPTLQPYELLIRTHAVAINPCDPIIQSAGVIQETFPGIIGCDLAGSVVSIGSSISNFRIGDRVIAAVESGAFQEYCAADVGMVAKLPASIPYEKGVVLPACLGTAATALFHKREMGLEYPTLEAGVKKNGKVVLVWGGASVVGSCAIQVLKAAGYEVAATASSHNHKYLKEELGVDGEGLVFDYKKDDVVEEILEGLKNSGKEFAGVFCAIIDIPTLTKCAKIADVLGKKDENSRVVGTVVPPNLPWIPSAEDLPKGVRMAFCRFTADLLPHSKLRSQFGWGDEWEANDVGEKIWGKWVTPALESGLLKCKPEPKIVGDGLEKIQDAVNIMSKGVSATKLVVTIP